MEQASLVYISKISDDCTCRSCNRLLVKPCVVKPCGHYICLVCGVRRLAVGQNCPSCPAGVKINSVAPADGMLLCLLCCYLPFTNQITINLSGRLHCWMLHVREISVVGPGPWESMRHINVQFNLFQSMTLIT